MTSHEMRNPLSAMLLCADSIAETLLEFQARKAPLDALSNELVRNNIDAAQTIVLCAQHQKRIIDDVLTLSKINSTMLHVTPVEVHVEETLRKTMKMFEHEFVTHDIKLMFDIESSYRDADIDVVFCDPVRLTQVFINLLSNAIKFTRSERRRQISVTLGASLAGPPKESHKNIQWFPSKESRTTRGITLASEWGAGESVYLYFAVEDTGRGLTVDERIRLFNRFTQASPKTHVQYGGSGLGLFISRELTELQGGEIGLASTAGQGSTFAFYIKARRSSNQTASSHREFSRAMSTRLTATGIPGSYELAPPTPGPEMLLQTPRERQNYRILLVEDNVINQKVLSKQLRNIGCTVYVTNHGKEALDFLATTTLWNDNSAGGNSDKRDLSLILMDLEMPIMDGVTCARRIRQLEREGKLNMHVPIIAVTANARNEQISVALAAGMDDIVPKPFQIPELVRKANQLMANSQMGISWEAQKDYFN